MAAFTTNRITYAVTSAFVNNGAQGQNSGGQCIDAVMTQRRSLRPCGVNVGIGMKRERGAIAGGNFRQFAFLALGMRCAFKVNGIHSEDIFGRFRTSRRIEIAALIVGGRGRGALIHCDLL